MGNENTFNDNNNSTINDSDNIQDYTINHCCICDAPISQNEKLCENCKIVYAKSNDSNDNDISTNKNNQNNQPNQNYDSSINNNNNIYYNNGYNAPNYNPNYSNRNGNNAYGNGNNYKFKNFIKNSEFINKLRISFVLHKSRYISVIIGIVVIVLAIILISNLNSYKRVIRIYLDIEILGKTEHLVNMVPEEYIENCYGDEESFIEINEKYIERAHKILVSEYGDNLKYSFKITKEKELSNSKYDNLCDALKSNLDIKKKEIGKAYSISFNYTVEGNEDIDDANMDIVAIQIHGKWYLMTYSSYYDTWDFLI